MITSVGRTHSTSVCDWLATLKGLRSPAIPTPSNLNSGVAICIVLLVSR